MYHLSEPVPHTDFAFYKFGSFSIPISKPDRLSLFCFLWAVASVFHIVAAIKISITNPLAWATGLFAVLLISKPRSILFFMLMLLCSVGKTLIWIPWIPNHLLFEMVINSGILLSCVLLIFPLKGETFYSKLSNLDREKLYDYFAPLIRISTVVLYFFAVLSKLNWDYLTPEISCATWWMDVIRNNGFSIYPKMEATQIATVYSSLLVEAFIPLFLCFKRTRTLGILLAIAFHFFLSLDPHQGMFSFVVLLFAIYTLFTPRDFPDKLYAFFRNLFAKNRDTVKLFSILSVFGVIAYIFIIATTKLDNPIKYLTFSAWYIWGIFMIIVYFSILFSFNLKQENFKELFSVKRAVLWVVPGLLLFNGFSIYLGLKTQLTFSMYSNLRIEGNNTNHLFIPTSWQVGSMTKDLIEIKDSDLKTFTSYKKTNQLLTFFEFKRIASKIKKDFYVKYTRNGKPQSLEVKKGISNNLEVTTPHSYLAAKFIRFRPVDKGPCLCKH